MQARATVSPSVDTRSGLGCTDSADCSPLYLPAARALLCVVPRLLIHPTRGAPSAITSALGFSTDRGMCRSCTAECSGCNTMSSGDRPPPALPFAEA